MNTNFKSLLGGVKVAGLVSLVMLLICGLLYPLALTGLSQLFFPHQANGSILMADGVAVGAEFVGQQFTDERYMQGRPSSVGYNTYTQADKDSGDYTGPGSGSNNYAATNPDLAARVEADLASFLAANPEVKAEDIPTDLLTASGSGLDPHISPASADIQLPRIAGSTGLTEESLREIVKQNTEGKVLGVFGENRVNVLGVNLDIAKELGEIGTVE